jgi:DNA-binding NarL/FixJ family response regulator
MRSMWPSSCFRWQWLLGRALPAISYLRNKALMSSPHRRSGAQGSFVVAARSELLVRGLKSLVSEEPGLRVLGTATDAMGALQAIRTHRPDIVVVGVELAMPLERLIDRQDVSFRAILVSTRPFMPSNAEKETNNACSFFDSNAPVEQIRALIQISAQCRERQSGVKRSAEASFHSRPENRMCSPK